MNLKEAGHEAVKLNELIEECVQCQALVHKLTFEINRSRKLLYGLKDFKVPMKYCTTQA